MRFTDILALIGAIIGLPSFIGLFIGKQYILGVLVVLLVIGFLYYLWDTFWRDVYTIILRESVITIEDDRGENATLEKILTIRANHKGLTSYTHRNISADGDIVDFQTQYGSVTTKKRGGDYIVLHQFPIQLKKWQTVKFDLRQTAKNCFTENKETVTVLFDYRTQETKIKIVLPETRECIDARVFYRKGSYEESLGRPHISPNRRQIEWSKKRLKVGTEYEIEWDW